MAIIKRNQIKIDVVIIQLSEIYKLIFLLLGPPPHNIMICLDRIMHGLFYFPVYNQFQTRHYLLQQYSSIIYYNNKFRMHLIIMPNIKNAILHATW